MSLPDTWSILEVVAVVVNTLLVLFIVPLRTLIERLQQCDDRLADRIQAFEVKVAETYVPRGELGDKLTRMDQKLDRIETRLEARLDSLDHAKLDKS